MLHKKPPLIRRSMGLAVALSAAALCVVPATVFSIAQDTTGQISGSVLDGDRRPVANARVTLNPVTRIQPLTNSQSAPAGTARRTVLSASNGTYVFTDVQPGEYRISVSKTGYLFSMYGMQSASDDSAYFELRPGEKATGIVLWLWEGGSISGTVRTASGSVVPRHNVQILEIRDQNGMLQLQSLKGPTETDDGGRYQFSDLAAGRYLVRTSPNRLGTFVVAPEDFRFDGSAIYYPGSPFPDRSAVITLEAGAQRADIDITIPDDVRGFQVAGRVTGLPSVAFDRTIRLVVDDAASDLPPSFELANTPIASDGTFAFAGVPPGRYRLRAFVSPGTRDDGRLRQGQGLRPEVTGSGNPGYDDRTAWVSQEIVVRDQALTDLALQALPGIRITGKLALTPEIGVDVSQIAITARSLDGWNLDGVPLGWVNADGTFVSPALPPGRFTLGQRYNRFWQLESMVSRGQDLTEPGVVTQNADVTNVDMTWTSRLAEVTGHIADNTGQARLDAYVVFVRDNGTGQPQPGARVGRIRPNRFGDYSLQLTAGRYLIMAIAGAVPTNWQDPQFVQSLIPKATAVTMSRGAATKLNLEARVYARK